MHTLNLKACEEGRLLMRSTRLRTFTAAKVSPGTPDFARIQVRFAKKKKIYIDLDSNASIVFANTHYATKTSALQCVSYTSVHQHDRRLILRDAPATIAIFNIALPRDVLNLAKFFAIYF